MDHCKVKWFRVNELKPKDVYVCMWRNKNFIWHTWCFQKIIYILSTTLLDVNNENSLSEEAGFPAIFSEALKVLRKSQQA